MMHEYYTTYKREIISTLIFVFCLLCIYAAILLIGRIGKVAVEFHVVPHNATVRINNDNYTSGTHYIPAGTYKAIVSHTGFESNETTIVVTSSKPKNILAVSLAPSSDEAKKWAETHQNDYRYNERYGAEQARQNGQAFRDTFPIVAKLPYQDPYYKIAYRSTDEHNLTVTITTESPRYRYLAVKKIRELGFNPTDYVIDFVDYRNPLGVSRE